LSKIHILRQKANQLYLKGQVLEALKIYKKVIQHPHFKKKVLLKDKLNDLQGIVTMSRYLGLNDEALIYAKKIFTLDSSSINSILTLSRSYLFMQNYNESVKYALKAKQIDENNFSIYDILAQAYMHLEDFKNARQSGIKSLFLKEKKAEKYSINTKNNCKAKPFNIKDKSKNIISFTLYGQSPKYCENAIINAQMSLKLYPHWTCRFYCSDDVPENIIKRLKDFNAQIIIKEKPKDIKEMLFWRFLVMSDKNIDRFIVRDCDSVINEKESLAVKQWVESEKIFHIMRDFYTHTELILAGMFGGVIGIVDDINKLINSFLKDIHNSRTHLDQNFLSQKIWPLIKDDVLIHDSCFHDISNNSIDFPKGYNIKQNHHIGMNEGAANINIKLNNEQNFKNVKWMIYDKNRIIICTYHSKIVQNSYNAQIPTQYAHKIQNKEYFIKSEPY